MSAPPAAKLAYSLCWEDPLLDLEALAPREGQTLVTLSSAGCNALSLLTSPASRIVAVDYNPWQNALLELKAAAVAGLDRTEYLAFVGERKVAERAEMYRRRVAGGLRSPAARAFWDARSDWLEEGIHRVGALERHFGLWRRLMRVIQGGRRLERMFESGSLQEQSRFFDEEWDRLLYRGVVRLFFNRRVLSLAKDPAHFRHVTIRDLAGNFLDKCRHAMTDLEIAGNYFLAQIFLGRYRGDAAVPPFLREEAYLTVRERLARLEVVTGDLVAVLEQQPRGSVHGMDLSNVWEWLSDGETERLFAAMSRAAAPGARATVRTLLADRRVPDRFRDCWRPLETLSRELHARDRSFLYSSFLVLEHAG